MYVAGLAVWRCSRDVTEFRDQMGGYSRIAILLARLARFLTTNRRWGSHSTRAYHALQTCSIVETDPGYFYVSITLSISFVVLIF